MSDDSQLNRVEVKIDKLDDRLDGVEKILVLQESNLREHMRRSDALQKMIEDERADKNTRLTPLETTLSGAKSVLKFTTWVVGAVTAIAGLIYTVLQIISR